MVQLRLSLAVSALAAVTTAQVQYIQLPYICNFGEYGPYTTAISFRFDGPERLSPGERFTFANYTGVLGVDINFAPSISPTAQNFIGNVTDWGLSFKGATPSSYNVAAGNFTNVRASVFDQGGYVPLFFPIVSAGPFTTDSCGTVTATAGILKGHGVLTDVKVEEDGSLSSSGGPVIYVFDFVCTGSSVIATIPIVGGNSSTCPAGAGTGTASPTGTNTATAPYTTTCTNTTAYTYPTGAEYVPSPPTPIYCPPKNSTSFSSSVISSTAPPPPPPRSPTAISGTAPADTGTAPSHPTCTGSGTGTGTGTGTGHPPTGSATYYRPAAVRAVR